MKTSIFQEILDVLNDNATISGYLGGEFCFRAKMEAPAQIPSITLQETSDKSEPQTCYIAHPTRDNSSIIQIDVWISGNDTDFPNCGEDADTIANEVDKILVGSEVSGTRIGTWKKISSTQQHESNVNVWHNAVRYKFDYTIED
ncbi:hypothetical protein D4R86_05705 [bacterium]|nr:MAG: hypothetical protein D4R86_05705 [bacterium]